MSPELISDTAEPQDRRKRSAQPSPPVLPVGDLPANIWLVGQESSMVQRRQQYTSVSLHGHPGKMLPALARRWIETYTRLGETVLDPLSGIGTTGVEAVHLGRHYIGIELEPRFVTWQRENLALAEHEGAAGHATVIGGDARGLDPTFPNGPVPEYDGIGPVDAILTSPPYGARLEGPRSHASPSFLRLVREKKLSPTALPQSADLRADNLGNLKDDTAYFAGMCPVYAGCFDRLKPGGLLGVVLRVGRDGHHLRPLHHETARLCQALGFVFLDEIVAVLARITTPPDEPARVVSHASWIRRAIIARLRERGYPVSLNQVEYVLLFQKPPEGLSAHTKAQAVGGSPVSTRCLAG